MSSFLMSLLSSSEANTTLLAVQQCIFMWFSHVEL
jgi:hypothetical protein